MAKQITNVEMEVPPDDAGTFILPDAGSFGHTPQKVSTEKPGRVHGLDYDQWAVALVNLVDQPDRIMANRLRMQNRGYKKLQGNPIVEGYSKPEVWVKPRAVYNADLEARRQRIQDRVDSGDLPESAVAVPHISRSRPQAKDKK
jgi:hypothetical protein